MPSRPRMRILPLVVAATALAAAGSLVLAITRTQEPLVVAGFCLLALVASALRSAHTQRQVELVSVVLAAVYVVAGPAAAVVVAAAGSFAQARAPLIKRIFNSAQRVLSAAGAAVVYTALGGPVGDEVFHRVPDAMIAITAATFALLVVNAVLVAMVLVLERGRHAVAEFLRHVVRTTAAPLLGYGLLGLSMAVIWLGGLNIFAAFLILGPLVVARWALSQYEAERRAQASALRAFIQLIEVKDLYTRGHSERVSEGVGMLGRHLKLSEDRQNALEHAGLLHDVGKVGVPTSIIQKPGRLDDSEMDAIRLHPARGVELIGNIPFLEEVKSAVLHHHEKYDGTGYPAGLNGTNIPYFARIIGIVDAFDCLTSTRSYRPARGVEETLAILEQDKYSHFDPQLVDAFVRVIRANGWHAAAVDQPAPDETVQFSIDHDDLSLGKGGGASGSAAGPR
ncbi:HD-GYP domain-containing protein [Kribbella catacumbae]|uniref:HD-GYP domain-containing protein n=1 Tax=Kribbella catacumbae TaxID=460086 RepID=UPI001ED98A35|nr:HD-GYP domain-containing protein [Kribbella catacumbae]